MRHPDYPEQLRCGCVCAENMEKVRGAARQREKTLESRRRRRARFPNLAGWKLSRNGNPYIRVDGTQVLIARRVEGFGVGLRRAGSGRCTGCQEPIRQNTKSGSPPSPINLMKRGSSSATTPAPTPAEGA